MEELTMIRRVDDLGRVVIPKEIRRNLKIKEGDFLEICVDDNIICFKKYPINEVTENENSVRTNN